MRDLRARDASASAAVRAGALQRAADLCDVRAPVLRLPDDLSRPVLLALLLLLGSIWGLTFSLAKIGGQGGFAPFGYAVLVHLGVGSVLLSLVGARRIRIPLDRATLRYALVAGLISSGFPSVINFTVVR